MSIDEAAGKIGLSIRATEEAPEQPAKLKKPRKRPAAIINQDDDSQGFNTLKDKLQEWITQSKM